MALTNDSLWNNPKHWKLGSIYVCEVDPRLVVPKKRKWAGWTFNFAHKGSYLLTIFVLVLLYILLSKAIFEWYLLVLAFPPRSIFQWSIFVLKLDEIEAKLT